MATTQEIQEQDIWKDFHKKIADRIDFALQQKTHTLLQEEIGARQEEKKLWSEQWKKPTNLRRATSLLLELHMVKIERFNPMRVYTKKFIPRFTLVEAGMQP